MRLCLNLDDVIIPGSQPIETILWLKDVLDSRVQSESLEGLMDFLTFLVQTLWRNKQK